MKKAAALSTVGTSPTRQPPYVSSIFAKKLRNPVPVDIAAAQYPPQLALATTTHCLPVVRPQESPSCTLCAIDRKVHDICPACYPQVKEQLKKLKKEGRKST
ncbi:MAG: hypothetical protein HOL51_25975 [Gemmatimonadetes bacterium]|nr:hypothetical protein [Gemmatimonadota bacterium]MBT5329570.1 hypothetical protein [Gemmatimonadota bacterium]MBT5803598.1 hypothetical protein [Gemmatimonadota bacterium]